MKTDGEASIPRPLVVVVDDDRAVRNSLKFALELEGFVVDVYAYGGDVLRSATPLVCACLVVDQNMPGMSGMELIARLRDRHVSAPAILITTNPSAAVTQRAAQTSVWVVEKPLLTNALLDQIRNACAAHGGMQS